MPSIAGFVQSLENIFFKRRKAVLALLVIFTLGMAGLASQLHMSAGFDKQLPVGHVQGASLEQKGPNKQNRRQGHQL